jgi:hypothetical protein
MAGETGFDDVFYDLVSVQYHALKVGHDYGQYVRDAKNAGLDDVVQFLEGVMKHADGQAKQCHQLLTELTKKDRAGPAVP